MINNDEKSKGTNIIDIMKNVKLERDQETQVIIDNVYKTDWSFLD